MLVASGRTVCIIILFVSAHGLTTGVVGVVTFTRVRACSLYKGRVTCSLYKGRVSGCRSSRPVLTVFRFVFPVIT